MLCLLWRRSVEPGVESTRREREREVKRKRKVRDYEDDDDYAEPMRIRCVRLQSFTMALHYSTFYMRSTLASRRR